MYSRNLSLGLLVCSVLAGPFPLDAATAEHGSSPKVLLAGDINLGLTTTYVPQGSSAWVPVYLANFTSTGIDSCAFRLSFDSSLFVFESAVRDSGPFVSDWGSFKATLTGGSGIDIRMGRGATGTHTIGYGGSEIVRCKFRAKPSAQVDSYGQTVLGAATVYSSKAPRSGLSTTNARMIVGSAGVLAGDVTGDGVAGQADADSILAFMVGRSSAQGCPNFTVDVVDVTRSGFYSTFDAAVIAMHGIGIVPELPLAQGDTLGRAADSVNMQLVMISKGGSTWEYRLRAYQPRGLLSAQFEIRRETSASLVVTSIGTPGSMGLGNVQTGSVKVGFYYTHAMNTDSADILVFQVKYPSTGMSGGLTFTVGLLNEGRLRLRRITYPSNAGFVSEYSYPAPGSRGTLYHYPQNATVASKAPSADLVSSAIGIRSSGTALHLSGIYEPVQVSIADLSGKTLLKKRCLPREGAVWVDLKGVAQGTHVLTVTGQTVSIRRAVVVSGR